MGGRRMLCQSLNAEFSEKGIHIAHIVIDGMVDAPDTLGKVLGPELYQKLRETKGNGKRWSCSSRECCGYIYSSL